MSELVNPHVCDDGTVYCLFNEGGSHFYVLLGSNTLSHRWEVTFEEDNILYVNCESGKGGWKLPNIPAAERPLDLENHSLTHAVRAFYRKYKPDNLGKAIQIAGAYLDKEVQLFKNLYEQYHMTGKFDSEGKLFLFYGKHAPDKIDNVPQIASEWANNLTQLWDTLLPRYPGAKIPGSSDDDTGSTHTATAYELKLVAFYKKADPSKLKDIPTILERYKGNEEAMFKTLSQRYPDVSFDSAEPDSDYKKRLTTFYERVDPSKLKDIPAILDRYKGKEEQLFTTLAQRYPDTETGSDHKQRLIDFYKKADPSKLGDVPAILERYKGNEEQLFSTLAKRYPDVSSTTTTTTEEKSDYEQKLISFYKQADPSKLQDIPTILERYKGKEEQLFSTLAQRYPNVNLGTSENSDYTKRLTDFYEQADPSKIKDIPTILERYKGKEEQLFSTLAQRYPNVTAGGPPSSSNTSSSHKEKLIAFYKQADPSKIKDVPTILEKYKGKEDSLFKTLSERYPHVNISESQTAVVSHKEKLTMFYQKADPSKVKDVPTILERYKGKEDALFKTLSERYPHVDMSALASQPTPAALSHKEKLVLFYEKADPSKVKDVPTILERYKGKEDSLFKTLSERYPHINLAELGAAAQPAAASQPAVLSHKEKLVLFYEKADPSKVKDVPTILERYKGKEDSLFKTLSERYPHININELVASPQRSSASPGGLSHEEKLIAFYEQADQSKIKDVSTILKKYEGKEESLFKTLGERYPHVNMSELGSPRSDGQTASPSRESTSSPTGLSQQERLVAFYEKADPSKVKDVPTILSRYKGKEESLFKTLAERYPHISVNEALATAHPRSPPASPATPATGFGDSVRVAPAKGQNYAKLHIFYSATDPSKLTDINKILSDYKGKETILFETLAEAHPKHKDLLLEIDSTETEILRKQVVDLTEQNTLLMIQLDDIKISKLRDCLTPAEVSLKHSLSVAKSRLLDGKHAVGIAKRLVKSAQKEAAGARQELRKSRIREQDLISGMASLRKQYYELDKIYRSTVEKLPQTDSEKPTSEATTLRQKDDTIFRLLSDLQFARFADLPRGHASLSDSAKCLIPQNSLPPLSDDKGIQSCVETCSKGIQVTIDNTIHTTTKTDNKTINQKQYLREPIAPRRRTSYESIVQGDSFSDSDGGFDEYSFLGGQKPIPEMFRIPRGAPDISIPLDYNFVIPETKDASTSPETSYLLTEIDSLQQRMTASGSVRKAIQSEIFKLSTAVVHTVRSNESLHGYASELISIRTALAAVAGAVCILTSSTRFRSLRSRTRTRSPAFNRSNRHSKSPQHSTVERCNVPPIRLLTELGRLHLLQERVNSNKPSARRAHTTAEMSRAGLGCIGGKSSPSKS